MKQSINFVILAVTCVLSFAGTVSAQSQLITWETSQPILSGNSNEELVVEDTVTAGTFVMGINATGAGSSFDGVITTVNNVGFTGVNGETALAGFTQNGVTATWSALRDFENVFGIGGITSDAVASLVVGGYVDQATVTLTGLTPGQQYRLQIFTNDARAVSTRSVTWSVGFNDGVTAFDSENINTVAGTSTLNNRVPVIVDGEETLEGELSGNFIIGTFVAGANGTQSFEYFGTRNGGTSFFGRAGQFNAMQLSIASESPDGLLGDVNMDGAVDFLDISPFIALLSTQQFQLEADINEDGAVNFLDISPFIALLSSQ